MLSLIKRDGAVFDAWKVLTLAENESAATVALPVGPLLVPVQVWHARRRELIEREYAHGWPLGVWLAAGESPRAIAGDVDDFSVIAVHFPRATDGRGCFSARLLRGRYGYRGELHAFGEVLREQVFYLKRSGFDAYTLRSEQAALVPVDGADAFDQAHRPAVAQPLRLVPRCPQSGLPRFDTVRAA
jgi:uncharacterized protein (DUF934 family)